MAMKAIFEITTTTKKKKKKKMVKRSDATYLLLCFLSRAKSVSLVKAQLNTEELKDKRQRPRHQRAKRTTVDGRMVRALHKVKRASRKLEHDEWSLSFVARPMIMSLNFVRSIVLTRLYHNHLCRTRWRHRRHLLLVTLIYCEQPFN